MSSPSPQTLAEVRAAFHELLDQVLDRACAPLTGGMFSTFCSLGLEELDGSKVAGVPELPVGLALSIGLKSSQQLTAGLRHVTAQAAAAGDLVRETRRSKGVPDAD